MSNKKLKEVCKFGVRLAQERKRLGYTQTELGKVLNKSIVTQVKYESGETQPDAEYFFALNELGADIYYIITGEQLEALKADNERQVLVGYRALSEREKSIVLNLINDMSRSEEPGEKNTVPKSTGKNKKIP